MMGPPFRGWGLISFILQIDRRPLTFQRVAVPLIARLESPPQWPAMNGRWTTGARRAAFPITRGAPDLRFLRGEAEPFAAGLSYTLGCTAFFSNMQKGKD